MMFPRAPRVRYGRSPLVAVICQLRFSPILKIDRDAPVELQEALRAELPSYQRSDIGSFAIAAAGQQVVLPDTADRRVEHAFLSADGQRRATLGRDFVAFTALVYPGWEEFERCLRTVTAAVEGAYKPAQYVRAGLRYQNVIQREPLGLGTVAWGELLRPSVAGLLAESQLNPRPFHAVTEAVYQLDGAVRARLAHGLVQSEDKQGYLIDGDFFVEGGYPLKEIQEQLGVLHEQAGWAFRWCIQDRLHDAMEPEPIP